MGWLAALLGEESEARRRGRKRRARHRHRTGNHKNNRKGKRHRKRKCAKLGQEPKKHRRKHCCKGLFKDNSGRCAASAPAPLTCGTGGPCLAFVTSTTHVGNLGGLAGADGICQQRAQVANLSGTYKAWLSDNTASPSTRFVQSTGAYQRIDGVTIAANWADLIDGQLAAPITVTETGVTFADLALRSWTHTLANGTAGGVLNSSCQNWTSPLNGDDGDEGQVVATSDNWTDIASGTCNNNFHLYCFQQS